MYLKGGEYKITNVIKRGGFGITYLGEQVRLKRKVAIKEYFIENYCIRKIDKSVETVNTEISRKIFEIYKYKFLKEANTIASMSHKGIISIIDVFEEKGTAYYVMEFHEKGSLLDIIPSGGFPEEVAKRYIKEIAGILRYIHVDKKMMHLDIKPDNILVKGDGGLVLIDFGGSKHYNRDTDGQTSETPPCVSEGFSPTEQYVKDGVKYFCPATDIYALGATYYTLLTGERPDSASEVVNYGLKPLPARVSSKTKEVIKKAMSPAIVNRPNSIDEFLRLPGMMDDVTPVPVLKWIIGGLVAVVVVLACILGWPKKKENNISTNDTLKVQPVSLTDGPVIQKPDQNSPAEKNTETVPVDEIPEEKVVEEKTDKEPSKVLDARAVDLGLSVKWAKENLKVNGKAHFSWGETEPKSSYVIGTSKNWNKIIENIGGKAEWDAAAKHWGNGWRLPTEAEVNELIHECNWTWVNKDGDWGYEVTGPNGNSIFLPTDGHMHKEQRMEDEEGYFLTSREQGKVACRILLVNKYGKSIENSMRYHGNSIRAVMD